MLPEYDFGLDWLAQRLKTAVARRGYALLVLSEGATAAERLADEIPNLTGIRVRLTRLGHAQRGAAVSHLDLQRAVDMSRIAHAAFKRGVRAGTVVSRDGVLTLQGGVATEAAKPAPDYHQYAFVYGL